MPHPFPSAPKTLRVVPKGKLMACKPPICLLTIGPWLHLLSSGLQSTLASLMSQGKSEPFCLRACCSENPSRDSSWVPQSSPSHFPKAYLPQCPVLSATLPEHHIQNPPPISPAHCALPSSQSPLCPLYASLPRYSSSHRHLHTEQHSADPQTSPLSQSRGKPQGACAARDRRSPMPSRQ